MFNLRVAVILKLMSLHRDELGGQLGRLLP